MTTEIVRKFDRISIEDLNVKGMVKNRKLSKSISDVSFGMIRRMLEYKCERYGRELVLVDRFFPSSKKCSTLGCDYIMPSLPLSVRKWTCPDCGTVHDRDGNSSLNIDAEGHSVIARGGRVRRPKISLGSLGCSGRRNVNRLVSCA
jgi:putative transposase